MAGHATIIVSDVPLWSILTLLGLLLVSSFFSMSETVFSSLNIIRVRTYIEENRKGSRKAYWIHDNFELTLSTILVGNNLANVALATVSVGVFSRIFQDRETLVMIANTFVMTTVILIFGEIIPKSIAKMHADRLALKISGLLYFIIKLLRPITIAFIAIKRLFVKADNRVMISVTEDELETIIDTMEEEGSIDEDEAEMLQSVLDLSDRKVYEIMTPRVDMVSVEINDPIEDIKQTFFEHQFSRLPVYEGYRDHVIGILNERDFFTCLLKQEPIDVRKLMKSPIFVSKSMRVDTLIETLQRQNAHIAIVSDEFGGTSGIVTMEDALEELVGEIYDEHDDVDAEHIQVISDGEYAVNADINLEDLFDELDLGSPPMEDRTLGGWLYECFEDIPEVDMQHTIYQTLISYDHQKDPETVELVFAIREIKDRRIKHVHLTVRSLTADAKQEEVD
ncbi:MAG: HlyC/CorC family transporter [Acholeplasmatales bacterium]|nr:MAG: HlyC/CorC family transporter [Acholeplasmatales bacterium]